MLKPEIFGDALRFLKKRDTKQFRQIFQTIAALCANQRPVDSIAMSDGLHYRQDVGDFRVIYRFDDENLYIVVVGNRNDGAAYESFKRLQ